MEILPACLARPTDRDQVQRQRDAALSGNRRWGSSSGPIPWQCPRRSEHRVIRDLRGWSSIAIRANFAIRAGRFWPRRVSALDDWLSWVSRPQLRQCRENFSLVFSGIMDSDGDGGSKAQARLVRVFLIVRLKWKATDAPIFRYVSSGALTLGESRAFLRGSVVSGSDALYSQVPEYTSGLTQLPNAVFVPWHPE